MFERNGKCIFEPGDAVYVYNNFSVSKVEIVPTVVTTTILNDQGVSYYVQGERFSYHEGNTFATEEEARKWAEENRDGWYQHLREQYELNLQVAQKDLEEAKQAQQEADEHVSDCRYDVHAAYARIDELEKAIASGQMFTIKEKPDEKV